MIQIENVPFSGRSAGKDRRCEPRGKEERGQRRRAAAGD
jgi:hypothetical protein